MNTRAKLALVGTVALAGAVLWLWRPPASPVVGLWVEPAGEQIRFRADGVFAIVFDEPLIGQVLWVPRDDRRLQGRYTFLDSTHIRTEFTHKRGSPRVFELTPSGGLAWTNGIGQLSRYEKRRFPF